MRVDLTAVFVQTPASTGRWSRRRSVSLTELGASVKDGSAVLAVAALVITVASLRAASRVTGVSQAQARA
jgi:hypothetical protein